MVSENPSIRTLKKGDIDELYDGPFAESVRGLAVESSEGVVAVAGVIHTTPLQAFSNMKDSLRKYPKTIMKTAIRLKSILNSYETPVYAFADSDEANSRNFLKHIGFEEIEDGVFKWVSQ